MSEQTSSKDINFKDFKSGFITFVGRPNAGKSTLINALVKQKVAITSNMPQTTRHLLRAVLTTNNMQAIFIDTPGIHKPIDTLGKKLNDSTYLGLSEIDIVVMIIDVTKPIGKGDKLIINRIKNIKAKKFCIFTKIELSNNDEFQSQKNKACQLLDWDEIVFVSAFKNTNIDNLLNCFYENLSWGHPWYDKDTICDQTDEVIISEIIREKAILNLKEEVPHSVGVEIDSVEWKDKTDLLKIYATIYIETPSQKKILIGRGGRVIKKIGIESRIDIEGYFKKKVYLDLSVKIKKHWRKDINQIIRFGYGNEI